MKTWIIAFTVSLGIFLASSVTSGPLVVSLDAMVTDYGVCSTAIDATIKPKQSRCTNGTMVPLNYYA